MHPSRDMVEPVKICMPLDIMAVLGPIGMLCADAHLQVLSSYDRPSSFPFWRRPGTCRGVESGVIVLNCAMDASLLSVRICKGCLFSISDTLHDLSITLMNFQTSPLQRGA